MALDPGALQEDVARRLAAVRSRITAACERAGRSAAEVNLVAVSKRMTLDHVRAAYQAGQRDFGENYWQELAQKADGLRELDIRWHFVGRLQRNKVRQFVSRPVTLHTVDSSRLIAELAKRTPWPGRPLPVFIQVNVGREAQKAGCSPEELPALVAQVREVPPLDLRGLMAIPPANPAGEGARPFFRELRGLAGDFDLPELSMGMSGDLEVAIEEGATQVRVGTAIFGPRPAWSST